jgi:RimJ/RimL family protein N-acetyltransferase
MSFLDKFIEKPQPPGGDASTAVLEPEKDPSEPEETISAGPGRRVEVFPYTAHADPQANLFLPWFWNRLKEDGLLNLYFPNDVERSFATFAAMMSGGARILLVALVDEATGLATDTIGFASWTPMMLGLSMVGNAGFIYLKDFWEQSITLAAGRRIEKMWFEEMEPKLDLAVGIIAKNNVLARRYINRLGWKKCGELPGIQQYAGEQADGEIWFVSRSQYESRPQYAERKP